MAGAPSCTEVGDWLTLPWQELLPVLRLVTDWLYLQPEARTEVRPWPRPQEDWQTGWLVNWKTGRLVICQTGKLVDWEASRLVERSEPSIVLLCGLGSEQPEETPQKVQSHELAVLFPILQKVTDLIFVWPRETFYCNNNQIEPPHDSLWQQILNK